MFTTIIEMIVCNALFMLLYYALFLRKADYGFCRRYLILTVIASALIPMMDVPVGFLHEKDNLQELSVADAEPVQTVKPAVMQTVPSAELVAAPVAEASIGQPLDVTATGSEAVAHNANVETVSVKTRKTTVSDIANAASANHNVWLIIYLCGALASLLYVLYGVLSIARLRRHAALSDTDKYSLAESGQVKSPFTFLSTVFLGNGYSGVERSQILSHESSHVRHGHSYEKLLMSVMRSALWFNPFVWLAEKYLDEVQEWQADGDALSEGYDLNEYRKTIIRQLFGMNPMPASGLKNSFTKKRLERMTRRNFPKHSLLMTASAAAVCAVLFVCFGCRPAHKMDSVIITADKFFDDGSIHPATLLDDGYYCFEDSLTTYCPYPAVIAATNVRTAKSPDSKELDWVNGNTRIIIGHRKSTLAEFKALKKSDYTRIVYLRSSPELSLVYAETPIDKVSYFHGPVAIDNTDKLPDIVGIGSGRFENVFIAVLGGFGVALPETKFAIDGHIVSYEEFKTTISGEGRLVLYKNGDAESLFGDGVLQVVNYEHDRVVRHGQWTYTEDQIQEWLDRDDRLIFAADRFYDEETHQEHFQIIEELNYGEIERGIEVYESRNRDRLPVFVAVNGYRYADSPSSKKLKWVNSSTKIFIEGRKSTLDEFKQLQPDEYIAIMYYRCKSDRNMSLVYVMTSLDNSATYNYQTVIDWPGADLPDWIEPSGTGVRDEYFVYQTDVNAATPDAQYVIDGKFTSYQEFKEIWYEHPPHRIYVFRNEVARRLFGEDVREVVEFVTNPATYYRISVKFYRDVDDNNRLKAFVNEKSCELDSLKNCLESYAPADLETDKTPTLVYVLFDEYDWLDDNAVDKIVSDSIPWDNPGLIISAYRIRTVTGTYKGHISRKSKVEYISPV